MRRVAAIAMSLLFVAGAIAQWNDPDPWAWMIIYGVAALVSLAAIFPASRPARCGTACVCCWLLCGVAMGWALTLLPEVIRVGRLDFNSEVQREVVGLVVISGWCFLLAMTEPGRGGPAESASPEANS